VPTPLAPTPTVPSHAAASPATAETAQPQLHAQTSTSVLPILATAPTQYAQTQMDHTFVVVMRATQAMERLHHLVWMLMNVRLVMVVASVLVRCVTTRQAVSIAIVEVGMRVMGLRLRLVPILMNALLVPPIATLPPTVTTLLVPSIALAWPATRAMVRPVPMTMSVLQTTAVVM
jgi:hypothetical protein